jgi:hypothetical protein
MNMNSRIARDGAEAARKFFTVVEALSWGDEITIGGGKGFGSGALKVNGKIFAVISSHNQFVVKLSRKRVEQLVSSGIGIRFEPRPGKLMKEWLVVKAHQQRWTELAKEACEFVRRGKS